MEIRIDLKKIHSIDAEDTRYITTDKKNVFFVCRWTLKKILEIETLIFVKRGEIWYGGVCIMGYQFIPLDVVWKNEREVEVDCRKKGGGDEALRLHLVLDRTKK